MDLNRPDGFVELLRPGRSFEVTLPPGEVFVPHGWEKPAFWVSDGPAAPQLWIECRRAQPLSGLWPVLMFDFPDAIIDEEAHQDRWQAMRQVDDIDVERLLATKRRWNGKVWEGTDFRESWQGLAPPGVLQESADLRAERSVVSGHAYGPCQLMLIPADRSADTVASMAWQSQNLTDPMEMSAILRSWEDRFGARVTYIGDGAMELSIAAPPTTRAEALQVVAEHLVFCADSLTTDPEDFSAHLAHLTSGDPWSFWWD